MSGQENLSGEETRARAREAMRAGEEIRRRVHDLTLQALRNRRFDREGIRQVVRAVTEGATLGAEASRTEVRRALADAFGGMDEALSRSAEAARAALGQMVAAGRDFSDSELKQALANLRKLEEDFLATVGHVAEAAGEKVAPELRRILNDARASGTETGRRVNATMAEIAERFSVASLDLALAGVAAATEFGTRFAALASGVLGGMADALRPKEAAAGDRAGKEAPPKDRT